MTTPINLLIKYKEDRERDLRKSLEMYQHGKISKSTHLMHKNNLGLIIWEYSQAILIFKEYVERNTTSKTKETSRGSETRSLGTEGTLFSFVKTIKRRMGM